MIIYIEAILTYVLASLAIVFIAFDGYYNKQKMLKLPVALSLMVFAALSAIVQTIVLTQ